MASLFALRGTSKIRPSVCLGDSGAYGRLVKALRHHLNKAIGAKVIAGPLLPESGETCDEAVHSRLVAFQRATGALADGKAGYDTWHRLKALTIMVKPDVVGLSDYQRQVIAAACVLSGIRQVTITSAVRSPADQISAMLHNASKGDDITYRHTAANTAYQALKAAHRKKDAEAVRKAAAELRAIVMRNANDISHHFNPKWGAVDLRMWDVSAAGRENIRRVVAHDPLVRMAVSYAIAEKIGGKDVLHVEIPPG